MAPRSLSRRRGTSNASWWLPLFRRTSQSPLVRSLLVLLGLAVVLSLGMVVLFWYVPEPWESRAARGVVDAYRARFAGVPHLLRGNIPAVPHPEPGVVGMSAGGASAGGGKAAAAAAVKDDDNKVDDRRVAPANNNNNNNKNNNNINNNNNNNNNQGDWLRGARPIIPPNHNNDAAHKQALDLNRYDGPPTKNYPYPLEPVSPDYTVKDYQPLGGMRYSEYTTGGTPYQITPDLRAQSDAVARSRRRHVKHSMKHAWKGYTEHAFGMDEVLPQSGRGSQNWGGQGITLVDALDTLWLMNLKDEFAQARNWVRDHLDHSRASGSVSVFETTIRDLGGLLSAYDWSKDQVFLDKALDLGSRLLKAFDGSSTGLPFGQVDLATGQAHNIGWTGGNAIISEFGTLQLENRYLAKLTHRSEFAKKTEHVFEILHEMSPADGLFPYFVRNNPRGGGNAAKPSFANNKITFGAMADSLYEYMLKIWIQGGRKETMYREMYDKAIDSMHQSLVQTSTPSGLVYIADRNDGVLDHKMDHLVCFMGGLLALGAYTDPLGLDSTRAQRDLRTGKALTYTCYQMYARMNTGISAEYVQFYPDRDLQIGRGAPHYLLRPEAVESFFILNQLTGDPVYREWGWEVWQSIEKYCKTAIAYGSLGNVQDTNGTPRDKMESFFLAETLKYLYLLQDPDTQVDVLNKHVFNTEAHPMRIFPVIDQEEK